MTKLNSKILIIIVASLFAINSYAQDWHFSQFNEAPVLINPANSGSYSGDFRANLNYKNQWSSIGNPYKTMAASFDLPALRNYNGYKMTGAGISFLKDQAGKSEYGFTQVNLSISQSVSVSKFQELSVGLSLGFGQISANFTGLRWDNQYNGTLYDPSLPTGESAFFPTSNYFDISAGFLGRFFDRSLNETQFGLSISHANRPWQATLSDINGDHLRMKFIVHGRTEIPLQQKQGMKIIPSLYFAKQAVSTDIIGGVNVKTSLGLSSIHTGYHAASFIHIGGYYRYNDALIAVFAYEWRSLIKAGISYDINFSQLTPATSTRGGVELSISWLGNLGFSNTQSSRKIRRRTF
jgi:type IX secretion system PorP/SprF family membrane protein